MKSPGLSPLHSEAAQPSPSLSLTPCPHLSSPLSPHHCRRRRPVPRPPDPCRRGDADAPTNLATTPTTSPPADRGHAHRNRCPGPPTPLSAVSANRPETSRSPAVPHVAAVGWWPPLASPQAPRPRPPLIDQLAVTVAARKPLAPLFSGEIRRVARAPV